MRSARPGSFSSLHNAAFTAPSIDTFVNNDSTSKDTMTYRDTRLARTQASAVSEHANETGHLPICKEVKFIDRDPHWYTRRVKEAIHIRLHANNIDRDSGIEIPEAWIPTIRKHNSRPTTKRTCEGTTSNSRNNNEDRNALIAANHHATNSDT